jgi:hypothetical protein
MAVLTASRFAMQPDIPFASGRHGKAVRWSIAGHSGMHWRRPGLPAIVCASLLQKDERNPSKPWAWSRVIPERSTSLVMVVR